MLWVVIPITSAVSSPMRPVQNAAGSRRMRVGYHKLNQVVTPVVAAEPTQMLLHCLSK